MNEEAYIAGFLSKCAEAGIDLEKEATLAKMLSKGIGRAKAVDKLTLPQLTQGARSLAGSVAGPFKPVALGVGRGFDELGLALKGETRPLSQLANRRTALAKIDSDDYLERMTEAQLERMLRNANIAAPKENATKKVLERYEKARKNRMANAQRAAQKNIDRRKATLLTERSEKQLRDQYLQRNYGKREAKQRAKQMVRRQPMAQEGLREGFGRGAVIPGVLGGGGYGLYRLFGGQGQQQPPNSYPSIPVYRAY